MKRADLTGRVFGRLTVVSHSHYTHDGRQVWDCLCDCGSRCNAQGRNLESGNSKSCGCLATERRHEMRRDLTGEVYGLLSVVRFSRSVPSGEHSSKTYWICICQCGTESEVQTNNLRSGNTVSCGCMHGKRIAPIRDPRHYASAERRAWRAMWSRCMNPNVAHYSRWGGRGIKVCDRWKDVNLFLSDVGPRPSAGHSLDRYPNPDGNYEPNNIRWATSIEQARNKSRGINA